MRYMGSKARYAKEILNAINNEIDIFEYSYWIEPLAGGMNMIDKVDSNLIRVANDNNFHLIEMFKALQQGWQPPDEVLNEEYRYLMTQRHIDQNDLFDNAIIGFVGFGCSYGGRYFEGYARGNDNKGNPRNYSLESKRNVLKQIENLKDVYFNYGDYRDLKIPPNSIVYCDPPYAGTKKYKSDFNHKEFWTWCNNQVQNRHKLFVSEYDAPEDWECIWEKEVNSSLTTDTGAKKSIERLFTK